MIFACLGIINKLRNLEECRVGRGEGREEGRGGKGKGGKGGCGGKLIPNLSKIMPPSLISNQIIQIKDSYKFFKLRVSRLIYMY